MTPNGGKRLRVAVRAAVVAEGRLLVLRYATPKPHCNLPGGSALPDESLADTAARKVAKNLGIDIVPGRLLFVHETLPAGRGSDPTVHHKLEFVLLAEPVSPVFGPVATSPTSDEHGRPDWVSLDAVADLPLLPPIQVRLARALTGRDTTDDVLMTDDV